MSLGVIILALTISIVASLRNPLPADEVEGTNNDQIVDQIDGANGPVDRDQPAKVLEPALGDLTLSNPSPKGLS